MDSMYLLIHQKLLYVMLNDVVRKVSGKDFGNGRELKH